MRLKSYHIRNFRRLEDVKIDLEATETIFVGANNSGKTSATVVFRHFLKGASFKIHDFSAPLMAKFDRFGAEKYEYIEENQPDLPNIDLDLWFEIDPELEYGRVAHLLPTVSLDVTEVGVRISFAVMDPKKLHAEYTLQSIYDTAIDGKTMLDSGSLSEFLSQAGKLQDHYSLQYFVLEKTADGISATPIKEKKDGVATIASLLRVDFVEAQRNIDDGDTAQSNRLSSVFSDFYKHHLEQSENDNDSAQVIHETNKKLTDHYEKEFSSIIDVIGKLGFPSLHDRSLKIISDLSPQQVLSGNTVLTYLERDTEHRLPEAYNGLGFKNLIFIAIQISHFAIQWAKTEVSRPLCHLMFVEEPEVHLHAQVQQTFISNIRAVISATLGKFPGITSEPQLVVTTHSSHILAEADFRASRYFKRTATKYIDKAADVDEGKTKARISASEVRSLRDFNADGSADENVKFLERYIKLTHCDLFFADGAILVEGASEKLLTPKFIEKEAGGLVSAYLTILELSGAFAHRFSSLLDFIGLPTLIITDLDSVDGTSKGVCRADAPEGITSNMTIKTMLVKNSVEELLALKSASKDCGTEGRARFIAFQSGVNVLGYREDAAMIPRTFEEAFIYENLGHAREEGYLSNFVDLASPSDFAADYQAVYSAVNEKRFPKVEFALTQIETDHDWKTPAYIAEGLKWLEIKLSKITTLPIEK